MLSFSAASLAFSGVNPITERITPVRSTVTMAESGTKVQAAGLAAALALAGSQAAWAGPFTRTDIASLTYEQIKGTGLANTCPTVETGGPQKIAISGEKKIDEFCLEPTSFQVRKLPAPPNFAPRAAARAARQPRCPPRALGSAGASPLAAARGRRRRPPPPRRPPSPPSPPSPLSAPPALPPFPPAAAAPTPHRPPPPQVLEEKLTKGGLVTEAVNTKVTTRQTYVLTGMEGPIKSVDGKLTFFEKDGIDYAPTTVQLPGGERVPFLFTVKNLVAKADSSSSTIEPGLKLSGSFTVPSYRTGLFLDPKGRGTTTGYDQAVALPALQAGDDSSLFKENNKKFDVGQGSIELKITDVNAELGEIGGVFVHKQPSDTDLGSKAPKEVLLKGSFFATVN